MLAAHRTSHHRTVLATWHPSQRLALLIWVGMVLAVSVRVAVARNGSGSVFPVYRTAASAWVEGTDLYTLDFSKPCFRYHPLIAAVFVPSNALPEKAAAILWRWLGVALLLSGMFLWQRQFLPSTLSPSQSGWFYLLAAPLALQSLNNGQVNLHLIGLILLALVAADRNRWAPAALLLAMATAFKLYPISIGLLVAMVHPRAFSWRYGLMLAVACLLPFLFQHPEYVAGQYHLWFQYLFVDARHSAAVEQAPRDLFLLLRFWFESPPEWLYRLVQLGSAGLLAAYCLRLQAACGLAAAAKPQAAILHLGCLWMTLLGPSTESCTYTLLAPTAAALLIAGPTRQSRLAFGLCIAGYGLLVLPVVAAVFPGGTQVQHWGPQPAGALLLLAAIVYQLISPKMGAVSRLSIMGAPILSGTNNPPG